MGHRRGANRLRTSLERLAHRHVSMPAPQVLVRSPGLEFEFGDQEQPFHAASVGKLMTATLIVMLIEQGRLAFETPIGELLPASDVDGLPGAPGVDVGREVTVEHLLTNTSGIPDFFEPPRGYDTAASFAGAAAEPHRRWTPSELLDEARRLPPIGRPGERFHYADTGYVLLGRIVEEASGESFADLTRLRIFEPCGMERSSTPYDAAIAPDDLSKIDVAPFWLGRHELSRAHSISLDWGGGNIVGTLDDFVRFQRALHGGRLISSDHLAHLARPRRRFRRGIHYGAGTMTLRFREFMPLWRGMPEPVGHLGVWATHMFYYPRLDAHVVLNFHSTRRMSHSFNVHARIAKLLAAG